MEGWFYFRSTCVEETDVTSVEFDVVESSFHASPKFHAVSSLN